ncbi:MAG: 2,4-dihydroxyhept-2-ene-1,7-dioic acid aldolase, partial [Dehalococcoidia bacterium]|nr:2,4-dihydroxyhept-2-ene-1,7-dioic acid aldolase [Dehalococcoidia bacterium]
SFGGPRTRLYGGADYFEHANEEIALMVQIEHVDAVNSADEILSVEGIDGFFIGPSDLAISMGLKPGLDQTDPRHVGAISKVLEVGKRHGVQGGIQVGSAEAVNERIAQGFKFIALSSDEGFLRNAASSALGNVVKDRKVP